MKTTFLRRGTMLIGALMLTGSLAAAQSRVPANPQTVPELKPEFDRAAQLGVPLNLVELVAREGYAKQLSPKVIRGGLRSFTDRIVTAREALAPDKGEAELVAGAAAIKSGATPAVLRSLRAAQRDRTIEIGLGVLAMLVEQGVSLSDAATKVELWLKRGATEGQILAAGKAVRDDVASGLAPARALDVRSQGVLSLLPAPTQGAAATQRNPR
jgi:hypothetical protein